MTIKPRPARPAAPPPTKFGPAGIQAKPAKASRAAIPPPTRFGAPIQMRTGDVRTAVPPPFSSFAPIQTKADIAQAKGAPRFPARDGPAPPATRFGPNTAQPKAPRNASLPVAPAFAPARSIQRASAASARPAAAAAAAAAGPIPRGFIGPAEFALFVRLMLNALPAGASLVFQGSSVSGASYKLKEGSATKAFDDGRTSDLDIAIVHGPTYALLEGLVNDAKSPGAAAAAASGHDVKAKGKTKIRDDGQSGKLMPQALKKLDLYDAYQLAQYLASLYCTAPHGETREVNFQLCRDRAAATGRKHPVAGTLPSLEISTEYATDETPFFAMLHGDVKKEG